MTNRSAVSTIKGYFYQFDYTIQKLLELEEASDTVAVEGIEDIDISTATEETAIQCKYYEGTEYNHSVIKKPIQLMLEDYAHRLEEDSNFISYKLYGYFQSGQEKLIQPIDIEFFKKHLLTYTKDKEEHYPHLELGLEDEDLKKFLSFLEIDINAQSYDSQIKTIISLLKKQFNCAKSDAENFYYNNALRIVKDLAIESDRAKREISKKVFLEEINTQQEFFDKWFLKFKGEKAYFKYLKSEYFTNHNVSPFARFFLLDANGPNYSRQVLKNILLFISRKYSKVSKRDSDKFCPYFHISGIDKRELIEMKTELSQEGYKFIDGYDFNGADFSIKSITQQPNQHNKIKIKFIDSIDRLDAVLEAIHKTKKIYQFFIDKPFLITNKESIQQIDIGINKLKNIEKIV